MPMRPAWCGISPPMRCRSPTPRCLRIARRRWCSGRRAPRCTCRRASRSNSSPPGCSGPRTLRVAPNGDVFVAESAAGRVRILRAARGAQPAAIDRVCRRSDLSVRHRVLAAGTGTALRLCGGDQPGRAFSLSVRRSAGARQAGGRGAASADRRTRDARSGVLARRPHDVRLGRLAPRNIGTSRRGGARRRAGVRCRWRQPAHLRHRPAQLHRRGDRTRDTVRCGAW